VCAQLQETPIEFFRKLLKYFAMKETPIGDDYCYLSHNCPSEEAISLAMDSHLQFCLHVSMHSNNINFFAGLVGKMCFAIQTQTKHVTP